jgi:hypothetical protein
MRCFLLCCICCFVLSCEGKKEVQLVKSNVTIEAEIGEHSPVYIFFKKDKKDTIADLNRANTISSTHWVFTIDKRLPLRLVLPQIIKMQAKKEGSMHKNETSQNYFSYADSIHKNLAFMPFSTISYKLEQPKQQGVFFIDKNNRIIFDGVEVKREEVDDVLQDFVTNNRQSIVFCFSKDCSFERYIQNKIYLRNVNAYKQFFLDKANTEYIY